MTDFDYRAARDQVFASRLPGALKLLLLALVEHMPVCRPSVATLALRCGVERKTILRALGQLERARVITIERSNGGRSQYGIRPVSDWREEYQPGTGAKNVPVPYERTGTDGGPVPQRDGTGTNGGMGPVPNGDGTGPILGPKAGRSRSESGKAGESAHARMLAGAGFGGTGPSQPPFGRATTMPQAEPTESYLAECTIAGVSPEQARSTWKHYWTQGLPLGGVEKLEPWLVHSAKEHQNKLTVSARASPSKPSAELDTTSAATAFQPKGEHRDFARAHLPDQNVDALAQVCRAVPRFARLSTPDQDREFLARLRFLKATGTFKADGPLKRPSPGVNHHASR